MTAPAASSIRIHPLPLLGLIAALLASGCGLSSEPLIVGTSASTTLRGIVPTAYPAELAAQRSAAADLTIGAQVFAENCTACHGDGGLGDGPSVVSGAIPRIVNFTDPATLSVVAPADYFAIITDGRLQHYMPPWGALLTEDQRWAVSMFVYGLRGVPPLDTVDNDSGEAGSAAPPISAPANFKRGEYPTDHPVIWLSRHGGTRYPDLIA